jgi:hypothetical protein
MSFFNNTGRFPTISGDLLVAGPKQLRIEQVEDYCSYLEWILDIELPEEVRSMTGEALVRAWSENNLSVIKYISDELQAFQQIKGGDKATREYLREINQQMFVRNLHMASMQSQGFPLFSALLQLYNMANAPIARSDGWTSLTLEEANCLLEFNNFIKAVVSGQEPRPLPQYVRDAQIQNLLLQYRSMPLETRQQIDNMPIIWTRIHACWPILSTEDKLKYIQLWKHYLRLDNNTSSSSPVSQSYQTSSSAPDPSVLQPYQSSDLLENIQTGVNQRGGNIKRLTEMLIEAQRNDDSEEIARLQLEVQNESQRQEANMTMLTNISQRNHGVMMSIISNIR